MCKYYITVNRFAGEDFSRHYGSYDYFKSTYMGALTFTRELIKRTLVDFQKANAATWLGDDLDIYLEGVHGFDMEGEPIDAENASLLIGALEEPDGGLTWMISNFETMQSVIIKMEVL